MKQHKLTSNTLLAGGFAVAVMGITAGTAMATEPCGDLGECKALVEINFQVAGHAESAAGSQPTFPLFPLIW